MKIVKNTDDNRIWYVNFKYSRDILFLRFFFTIVVPYG